MKAKENEYKIVLGIELSASNPLEAAKTLKEWLTEGMSFQCFVQNVQTNEIVSVDLEFNSVNEVFNYEPLIKQIVYYSLWDAQTGRYLQTGLNSTSLNSLLKDFIDYISVDFDEDETKDSYYEKYKNNPEILFNSLNFFLECTTNKIEEEE